MYYDYNVVSIRQYRIITKILSSNIWFLGRDDKQRTQKRVARDANITTAIEQYFHIVRNARFIYALCVHETASCATIVKH